METHDIKLHCLKLAIRMASDPMISGRVLSSDANPGKAVVALAAQLEAYMTGSGGNEEHARTRDEDTEHHLNPVLYSGLPPQLHGEAGGTIDRVNRDLDSALAGLRQQTVNMAPESASKSVIGDRISADSPSDTEAP